MLVAPVVAHGGWLPLGQILPSGDSAVGVTLASLAVGLAAVMGRRWGAGAAAGIGSSLAAVAALALRDPAAFAALMATAAVSAWLAGAVRSRLPSTLDGLLGWHRGATIAYVALALVAVVQTARVATFIGDPTAQAAQIIPGDPFFRTHCCATAYVHGARLARERAPNLYDAARWPELAPGGREAHPDRDQYAPLDLDAYAYPPPFLLVASLLAPWEGRFLAQRAVWFGLNALFVLGALWVAAHTAVGPLGHRVILAMPVLWSALPLLASIQVGNVHAAVVAAALLAMLAFGAGQLWLGATLLALAISAKISPGILGFTLLARGRWAEVGATTLVLGGLAVASALAFGVDPWISFLTYELPRLSSGEALGFLAKDAAQRLNNYGPFGLGFKLELLGLDVGDPWRLGHRIQSAFTVALVALAVAAGRRGGDLREQAAAWLALLALAALRSPFAPGYVAVAHLWMLTLLLPEVRGARQAAAFGLVWFVSAVLVPLPEAPAVLYTTMQTGLILVLPTWVVLRRRAG